MVFIENKIKQLKEKHFKFTLELNDIKRTEEYTGSWSVRNVAEIIPENMTTKSSDQQSVTSSHVFNVTNEHKPPAEKSNTQ